MAKQIYEEQLNSGWPGLISECKGIIKEWDLPDILNEEHGLSKGQWKTRINEAAKIMNGQLLTLMMKDGYSKLQNMKSEEYEEKK